MLSRITREHNADCMMNRLKPQFKSFILISMMALASSAMSQTAAKPHKVLTPEQRQYQAQAAQWLTEREALRVQATNALDAEMQRGTAGDCPDAHSTMDAEKCLDQAIEVAQKNYLAFTSALRSMLGLAYPRMPGEKPVSGPTGTPLTATELVTEFDQLESQSKKYREAASTAAYHQFKGGTHAPVFEAEMELKLLRLHLQELSSIYGNKLSKH
jgi:hypothetical protein